MPYTLEGMKSCYKENKQDYLAPILHDAITRIIQLEEKNEALRKFVKHKPECDVWNQTVRYFQDGESDICDCGIDTLLK